MEKLKVILLGATGRVGPGIVEEYLENYFDQYDLILGFHKTKPEFNLEMRKIDLTDIKILKKAFAGIDVVIDLAANADEKSDFEELVKPNIVGVYNVLEAAKESKCKRVIFASSVHAIKGYSLDYEVKHDDIQKPLNFYGATKVFGEALCHVFSSKYGLSCLVIRIGAYVSNDQKERVCFTRDNYHYVITQRDLANLISKCVTASEKIKFGILAGISDNRKKNMDLKFSKDLVGYEPQDDVYKICEGMK